MGYGFQVDTHGVAHHFHARAFLVVGVGARGGGGGVVGLHLGESEQFGAYEAAVFLAEGLGELLHEGVVLLFTDGVAGSVAAVVQAGEQEHPARCAAGLTHAPDASAERGRQTQGEVCVGDAVQVGARCKHRLAAVVSLSEQLFCPFHAFRYFPFFHNYHPIPIFPFFHIQIH